MRRRFLFASIMSAVLAAAMLVGVSNASAGPRLDACSDCGYSSVVERLVDVGVSCGVTGEADDVPEKVDLMTGKQGAAPYAY